MTVTFKGNPITLCGKQLQPGDSMPDFTLTDNKLQLVRGKDLSGVRVFLTIPSLDTGVCDQEVRRFNEAAAAFPAVNIYAVSLDLPFAQSRWCGAAGVEQVQTLSDYRDHSFGKATGTRMEELGLLTRAVILVDNDGTVAYVEYVPEVTSHPDYDTALEALRKISR
ncbi:MAG: thiol peroxidase [Clostridiales bacterium]|nr:thiol peroxidase [Clostridiales bacterium]